MTDSPASVKLIAEIGCNHKGDIDIAKEMIRIAAGVCGADVVKFQKRCARELLSREQYDAPHPVVENAYGPSYGAHRERLEFDQDQHRALKEECAAHGVIYSSSVWDMTSAREIVELAPPMIKVPSATNLHFDLVDYLCEAHEGEIHLSVGMTTMAETDRIVDRVETRGRAGDLVLYACTSGYPVAFEDVCVFEVNRLQERYRGRIGAVGFSGHHLGIAVDIAAMTAGVLGAAVAGAPAFRYVERHFTLDRTWKGTDHAASLEPDGLRRLRRDLANVGRALTRKPAEILHIEEAQRAKLKWRPRDA